MIMKKINFTKLVQIWGIIFLIGIGVSIIIIDTARSYRDFSFYADQMRADYTARQKQLIKHEVERVVDKINYEKAQSKLITKSEIKSRTYEAYSTAQNIYQQNQGIESKAKIKQMILEALRPVRFKNGSGYYFAVSMDGIQKLHPLQPELEEKNLIGLQDYQGNFVIQDEINVIKKSGEGFVTDFWPKPSKDPAIAYEKISFIKYFKPLDWYFGTGLYVDDIKKQIKANLLSTISMIRFGKEGYIFVNRLNGDALVSNGKLVSGEKKLWEVFNNNSEKTKQIFDKEYNASLKPDGDYIYYSLIKLSDPTKESPKASFVCGIPELQWLVGAGVYLDDVETYIARMQTELNNHTKMKMFYSALIATGIFIFYLILFSRLSRRLANDFDLFISFFKRAAISDAPINRDLIQFDELDRMAENANKMLADRKQAEEDLKTSEEMYSAIFHEARDGIVLIEAETGRISDCNPQFEEMTGSSISDLRQIKIWEVSPPYNVEKAKEKFHDVIEKKHGESIELDLQRPDGTIVPIEFVSKRVYLQNNNLVLSVARDTTERKRVEEALQKMEKLKSIGTLAGGIAHDFNNILTGLFGNISIAKETLPADHPGFKYLEEAEKAMNRAIRLTKQLLTFAKGGAPVTENIRLDSLIVEIANFDLSGSNVKLIFESTNDLWSAKVDKGQIQQVFSNLTLNARQSMPDGGHLYITLKNADISENKMPDLVQGKYIQITVTDEGGGIDQKHLGRIFEPYFTTKHAGSGLGLATSHSIIHRHGGCISVDSQLGKGTIFIIYLPVSETQQPTKTKQLEAKHTTIKQTARILVMDDDKMIRDVAKTILETKGYWVETADGGTQTLKMYKQAIEAGKSFDVIIMDLTIPGGIGGKESVKDILEINPKARVIVSSGYANDPIMANFSEYGFSDVVAKPYTLSKLLAATNRVLKK